ncbi:hypothetical protein [Streptomyces sp. NPDC002133]|uniref:hypothetical protein n=1 Tax=Streptomyces sp. NPDC002133 TaxID=3154409 RepID=UPI003320FB2C
MTSFFSVPTLVGLASSQVESFQVVAVLAVFEVVDSMARLGVPGAAAVVELEKTNSPPTTRTMSAGSDRALARRRPEHPVRAVIGRSSSKGRISNMARPSPE